MEEQKMGQESSLTFGEIFQLLKKGWVMLLIAVLIGVIVATSVLLVLREAIGTTNYETQITFSSASISDEEGFNPSTTVNKLIKSDVIISRALTNLGYSQETQQQLYKEGLVENLSAYATEEKTDTNGVAYPYVVTLSLKKLGNKIISKAQAAALIEEITKQVVLATQEQYKKEISFNKLEDVDYEKYNYLQAYDKLNGALNNVTIFASGLSDNVLDYSKNGKTIKAILAKFDDIKDELEVLRLRLVNNALVNPDASAGELDYATYNEAYYSQMATQLETRITSYATLLKETKPDITVMTGTVTIEALKSYYELVDRYNELQDEYSRILANASDWEKIKTAYSGTVSEDVAVRTAINSIVANYNEAYSTLEETIKTYNDDNYASSLVVETKTVKTIKNSVVSPLIIGLVDIVVIAIIMLAVVIVEKKKEKKVVNKTIEVKE